MPLTDVGVRQARARERVYRLNDGRGLVLLIQPNGSKWWRFRYRWKGVERMLSMGTYPDTPLIEVRQRREAARQSVAKGIDPGAERRLTRGSIEPSRASPSIGWRVRSEGVTEAAGKLQELGIIRYSGGQITVLERPKLEQLSCECYVLIRKESDRLQTPEEVDRNDASLVRLSAEPPCTQGDGGRLAPATAARTATGEPFWGRPEPHGVCGA
jgi:hypothetical protein